MTLCRQEMHVDRLQLIGITSLFLAAKVEEIYPPKLKDLASHMENYSDDNEEAVQQFELFMLKTLNWEISPVTANSWLQVYLQIAAHRPHVADCFSVVNLNYPAKYMPAVDQAAEDIAMARMKILTGESGVVANTSQFNTIFVLPLSMYKNQIKLGLRPASELTEQQERFFRQSYMKAVTLLDLCTFDMDSLRFSYSVLAASAMFHMLNDSNRISGIDVTVRVVQECSGYRLNEIEACVQWMHSFSDICKEVLTVDRMITVKTFSTVEEEDSHNIQLFHKNLELLVSQIEIEEKKI